MQILEKFHDFRTTFLAQCFAVLDVCSIREFERVGEGVGIAVRVGIVHRNSGDCIDGSVGDLGAGKAAAKKNAMRCFTPLKISS